MKKTITGILFLLSSSLNLFATNYYISNNGNDDASGLSPETAWETISKVNSTTFNPGDSIKFRCGDRWFGPITLTESGNSTAHITITNYGTGAKPKLYGSKAVTSFTEHAGYENVYRLNELIDYDLDYSMPNTSGRGAALWKIQGESELQWSDQYMRETSFGGLDENYEYYWRNDSLYVYYDGDINNVDTIEVMQSGRGITLIGEYYTIDGLDVEFWGDRCIGMYNYPEVTKRGFILRNCEIAYTASREDGVGFGLSMAYSNMIIENNNIHHNGRRNISMNCVASSSDAIIRDVIIRNNKLHDGFHTTGVDISIQSADNYVRNVRIYNNLIYDPYEGNGHQSESIFLQNTNGVANNANYDSIYIYNNIILNTTLDGVYLEHIGDHVYIVNNTMTGGWKDQDESWKRTRAFIFYTTSGGHLTVMNNIFCNYQGTSVEAFDGASDGGSILDTWDYNLNYSAQNPNASYIWTDAPGSGDDWYWSQYSNLAANGYELHSPDPAPPCLIDSTGTTAESAILKPSSPAIGAATPVSFVTTDFYGNPRDPEHPTIGAYEYVDITGVEDKSVKPEGFNLSQNYPNPFNPTTTIEYSVGAYRDTPLRQVRLEIFNTLGQKVATLINKQQPAGNYKVKFNASNLPSGVYIYQIQAGSFNQSKKMLLLK